MASAPRRKIDRDFIDRYQVAALLGLAHPESYSGYAERYATIAPFPPVVRSVVNSAIRRASQVHAWRLTVEGKDVPPRLAAMAAREIPWPEWALDRKQVAAALRVSPATVSRYAADPRQKFPEPTARYAGHPVWDLADIEAWDETRPGPGASRGARVKETCPGCGLPRVVRGDGSFIVHAVAPSRGGGICSGSGQPPANADAA